MSLQNDDININSKEPMKIHEQNLNDRSPQVDQEELSIQYIKENIDKSLIIFCNPLSGNQEGKIFLKIANRYQTEEKYKIIDFPYLSSKKKKI